MRVGTGKVEIGQGILTALTQIAAEELDVRPEQINLVSGQTDVSPAEGFTSGSYSVAVGGASIRLVCAEVRSLFLDTRRRDAGLPGERAVRSRTGNSCAPARTPAATTGRWRAIITLERRASGTAPVKRPSTYKIVGKHLPRLDLPAKVMGGGFIHDIAPDDVLHARVLRQPWRGAHLVALDETAVRKAARRPIEIMREGEFVAFTSDSELAVMRASEAARMLAKWEGGTPAPADIGTPDWLKRQPRATRSPTPAAPAARRRPHRRGALLAAVPHLRLDRPVVRAGRVQGRRAQGLVAHARPGDPARLARQGARAARRAGHGVPPPGRRRLWPQHRRRRRLRRLLHRDAPCRDAPCACNGRARTSSPAAPISTAMAISLRAVLDADNKPADWQIEIWSPPHAQRPGMNGNSNLLGARSAAQSAAAERTERRARRARRRRHPQRRRRSTICRATG